ARRHILGFALLLIALLTKETAVWAPVAAALTILVRKGEEAPRRRALVALAMLAPLITWVGYRIVVFGGVGGTYATTQYIPLSTFLELSARKLMHLPRLFVMQGDPVAGGSREFHEWALRIGVALLVFLLLVRWVLSGLRAAAAILGKSARERP